MCSSFVTCVTDIFSYSVAYLLPLLIVLWKTEVFSLSLVHFIKSFPL